MSPPSCDITRRLCFLVTTARGELRIGTADLQQEIGLVREARHTVTLAAVLDRAKNWFAQQRGVVFEWEFVGSDIVLRYRLARRPTELKAVTTVGGQP
jgi:hypothetical protein